MRAVRYPTRPILSLTSAHRRRFSQLADDLRHAGHAPAALALLDQLTSDIDRLRADLSPAARSALEELEANEHALCQALAATKAAFEAYHTVGASELPTEALTDPAALRRLSELLNQLAQAAGELALRAQARASLLDAE